MLISFVLASAALFVQFVGYQRRRRVALLRDAVRVRGALGQDTDLSVFDVFWDLGASDFALEVMAAQNLLPTTDRELALAHDSLADRVREEGSYRAFVDESLEAIQEFYDQHRTTGSRRELPFLTTRNRKTLALPAVAGPRPAGAPPSVADLPHPDLIEPDLKPFEVDIDAIGRVDVLGILKGVLLGRGDELDRWWQTRTLRGLRDTLDQQLKSLYDAYAFEANTDPDFYRSLYDLTVRWENETRRLERLAAQRPWRQRPWRWAAEALILEAHETAGQLASRARANVDQTIELIHAHARRGDVAMAGYLVFLNRHAFFVGRMERYGEQIVRIETTTQKLQDEMRTLARKRVI